MKPEIKNPSEFMGKTGQEATSVELSLDKTSQNEKLASERVEPNGERSEIGAISGDVNLTTTLPYPVKNDNDDDATTVALSDAPMIAADDDLIEKEWVDKAKAIVIETKDNPHQREDAVSQLQIDYLKKRYGKEFGSVNN